LLNSRIQIEQLRHDQVGGIFPVVFIFLYRKLNNMDGVKQQDSTPQNDSTLGFKWIIKITQKAMFKVLQ
jgi:hypothetical protein